MLTFYFTDSPPLDLNDPSDTTAFPKKPVWIDAFSITEIETQFLQKALDIDIPTSEEIWKNDALGRMQTDQDISYFYASIITKTDTPFPKTSTVAFILSPSYLLTLRSITPTSFRNFSNRLQKKPQNFQTGPDVLAGLLNDVITRVAYNADIVDRELDSLSHEIFAPEKTSTVTRSPSMVMQDTLKRLGANADLNSQINESLHSLRRVLTFLIESPFINASTKARLNILMMDTHSLSEQSSFLSDKVTFQLDATLGMINVEQNMIIKIFSVVAVFFLPPTMVSSIYGMNFHFMPELSWVWGYPFALFLMAMCGVLPYIYFRKRGWL